MDALESLQDSLGALNDLAAGPEVLDRLGLLDLPGAGALVEGGDRAPLLKAAAEAHDRLVGTRRSARPSVPSTSASSSVASP